MNYKSLLTLVILAFGSGLFATTTANKSTLKAPTNVSINDVSINEGTGGTTTALHFSVTRDNTSEAFTLTVNTNDGSATLADNDYVVISGGTVTFTAGGNLTETVTVLINHDTKVEANETFTVLLSGASGMVTITDGSGMGTITNDEVDFGDVFDIGAPFFATTLATNGARHNTVLGLHLGAAIDGDSDGQGDFTATGDDTDADGDDEDGVVLPVLVKGATANIAVTASAPGFLDAWVDFEANASWDDSGNQVFSSYPLLAGVNNISFNVPVAASSTAFSFARFRFSSTGGLSHTGAAADGEVEDYLTSIIDNLFSIDNPSVTEGNAGTANLVFTVNRSNNAISSSVDYAITGGTATSGTDHVPLAAGTINFAAGGALSQTITVTVNGDLMVENNETIVMTLSNPVNGTIGAANPGTGTITNDDAAVVTLSGGVSQNEGTNFVFTATLDNPVQGGFTLAYTTNNGTASTADGDYTDNDATLTFSGVPGAQTITVVSTTDNKVELAETFTVTLGAISGAPPGVTTAGSPQTGTIANDDAATVSLAGNVSQAENLTPQVFTVNLSNPVDVAVTVLFNTSNGTATTVDNDYTGIVNQAVTFAANTTTAQTVNTSIANDNKVEANEVYNVAIGTLNASGRNVTLGTSTGTGTINNDDAAVVTLSGGGAANEGNTGTTSRVFTATLNNPVQGGFTVPYTTNDGTATTADNDYLDNDGPALSFAGTTGEAQTITVLVNGDTKVEANETFTVTLGSITGAPAGVTTAGSPQTGTINNDEVDWGDGPDSLPTSLFNSGARHNTVLGFHLGASVDGDPDGQMTGGGYNNLANGDDTDADGDDEDGVTLPGVFVRGTTASITVNASQAGKLDAFMDFNWDRQFSIVDEKIFNNVALAAGDNVLTFNVPGWAIVGSSFMRFRFSSAGGLPSSGPATDGEVEDYRVQIANNQFSIDNPSVAEGNVGTTDLVFTVSRTTNTTASSVDYAITGGTATSGTDYQPLAAGTINFAAGGPLTQNVTVTVNGDLMVENNETVVITLSNPVNGGIGSANPGTGTITNDDSATLTLSGGIAQNETNAGTVNYTFTATLSAAVQGGFTVPYTTNNGTASTADNDYTDNDGNLVFAGTAGETKTFTVTANGDTKVELDETFTTALGALTGTSAVQIAAISLAGTPQTGTILNDDAATVSIAGNVSQAENLTPQVFTVNLSNPVDVAVTVLFNTSNGTATTADNDYTGIVNQTVTFAANTTTAQTVNTSIANDNKVEANEVYNVAIGTLNASGRNVTLGTSTGTGTINNDDAAVVTLSGGGAANEGNTGTTSRVFTATLNNPVQGGFTVPYTTNDGTATTADNDYLDNDGPALSFAGTTGEAQTITVLVNGDTKVEANETFTVTLGSITGAPAGVTTAGSPQTGTINNDEVDWGDGPDSLPTILFYNGARHNTVLGFQLGTAIDGDPDGQMTGGTHSNLANGDDTDSDGDDEDGVTLPGVFVRGTTATITVNASQAGKLDAFMDFNWNRVLGDAGEKIFNNVSLAAGDNVLTFNVPGGAVVGSSFMRFRFSSAGGLSNSGLAADGEVEDYRVQIVNNQFSIDNPSVAEGNAGTTDLVFTVSRTTNTIASSVDYAITGGTATSGTDYQPLAAGTINFAAGGPLTQNVTVTVNGDLVVENNETVVITLSNPVNGGIGSANPGTGTITNDDSATLTLSGGIAQNETNAGTVNYTFTATLSAVVQGGFTVPYTTNNGTASTADNDYTDNDGNLVFAGTAGETKTFTVTANGDTKVELDETFTTALGALTGTSTVQIAAISLAGTPQTGTILNDDAATVSIAANVSQSEATTPQAFSVTLSNPVDVPVTVQFNTNDATATTADNDYTGIVNQTVTFAVNTTTAQLVNVAVHNDAKVEAHETYTVTIANLAASGRNVVLGATTRTGTIQNDDATNLFIAGPVTHPEGNAGTTNYLFSISITAPVQDGFSVNYTTNDGSATTANIDYVDNDGTLSYTGINFNETKTVTVQGVGDLNIENDEVFTLLLGAITAATPEQTASIIITGNNPETGTILNDELDWGDAPSAAQSGFAGTYPTLAADNGARHAELPGGLRLGATLDADLNGQPNATASGDGADEDGVTLPSAIVMNTNANITVNASASGLLNAWVDFSRDGDWSDPGEQIFTNQSVVAGNNALSFAVPGSASPGGSFARFRVSTAAGTTFDGLAADGEVEDYAINIVNTQFNISDPTVAEGNAGTTNLGFVISRTVNANACSVDYAITGGTATTADNDYQILAAGTVNFTAGGAFSQTVNVVVNGDVKVELNETVDMTLSNPVNGSILDGSGTGTITNDDAATITITNPLVTEGDIPNTVTATFTINMSNPSDANVSVNYMSLDGSATIANSDYVSVNGSHTFTPGQISKTVAVIVNGDCGIEPNETFLLRLSGLVNNGRNVSLSGGGATLDGTGTINNDDALPVITCPASMLRNVDPGVCTTNVTLPLPTTSSVCGSSSLEFRYRTVDASNVPTGPYNAYAPSSSNMVIFSRGRYEVEWRITDGSGSSVCSFFLQVNDTQAPIITCPANQNIPASASCAGTVGTWTPASLSDNCTPTGLITVTQTPPANTVLSGHNDSELVTLTANDGNGNTSSCSFTVTLKDVTLPTALCKNVTANLGANGTVTVAPALVNNGSSDNCTFTLTLTPNTFTCLNIGMNTVVLRATDAAGNSATCSAKVTVKDASGPVAKCKNPTIFLDNLGQATLTVAQVNNGSTDNCGIATMSISETQFNCSNLPGSAWPVTLSLTDVNGNFSSCLSYVTVKETIAPTAICEDVTVQLNASGNAVVYGADLAAASIDNCSVWSYSPIAKVYKTFNIGNNNLTITVKDWSGNASTCVSVVTVLPFNALDPNPSDFTEHPTEEYAFNVYPNPTTGDAAVAFELPMEQAVSIRVYDLQGRMILSREDQGFEGVNTLELRLEGVPPGLYLVDFQSNDLKALRRLMVQE